MTNPALHAHMIDRYNELAYTHQYIWGFIYKGNVYMAVTGAEVMPFITCLDRASRGAGYALRFCPTTAQKLTLLTSATLLCSEAYFKDMVASTKYNNGEIFEMMVTEHFGQVWEKDNIPFTKAGDIKVGETSYQIKFQKATFCNEQSLANLTR